METDTRKAKYFDSETDTDEFVTETEAATGSRSTNDDSQASLLIKFKDRRKRNNSDEPSASQDRKPSTAAPPNTPESGSPENATTHM